LDENKFFNFSENLDCKELKFKDEELPDLKLWILKKDPLLFVLVTVGEDVALGDDNGPPIGRKEG